MAPRAPTLRTLKLIRAHAFAKPFVCPSCQCRSNLSLVSASTRNPSPSRSQTIIRPSKQQYSSIAPVTEVNATKPIPSAHVEIHRAISTLGKDASSYVNLSQLQLALRSLESSDSVTRVAVLSFNDQWESRRLVAALLADPLGPEALWERHLKEKPEAGRKALLIRYGEQYQSDDRHALLRMLSIPSITLSQHKLEILIHVVNNALVDIGASNSSRQQLLIPALETQSSTSGRNSMVAYPVHKTIVYSTGISGLLSLPSSIYRNGGEDVGNSATILGVVDGAWPSERHGLPPNTLLVNLGEAEQAIISFRQSLENSVKYEQGWLGSNLSDVNDWLTNGTAATGFPVKPVVKDLIQTLLGNTQRSVEREETLSIAQASLNTVPSSTRTLLQSRILSWAESAHTELRDKLGFAFTNKTWHKLAWWKLPWRLDDVGMITADTLEHTWLVDAEKELIWVGGQIYQSRLLGSPLLPKRNAQSTKPALGQLPPTLRLRDLVDETEVAPDPTIVTYNPSHPWPQQISLARARLVDVTVPPLQLLAQKLLLQTLSTTALMSTLSALIYISFPSTSVYEAGTVAAVGLVWSVRRLQTRWEGAKRRWVQLVQEDAKSVLHSVERTCLTVVENGGRANGDVESIATRRRASESIELAREALRRLG